MAAGAIEQTHPLEPYVPRVLAQWDLDAPGRSWQRIDGTLCFVDISGFTNLSEKLASRGRIGAEELTDVLDRVFGDMLRLAYDRGGSLLKFGGDALLLLFEGDGHAMQGTCAAIEMRAALREAVKIPTSVGRIRLRMSVGVHTGPVDLFRVGESHNELIITGETATATTEMESTADAGEIVISRRLRDELASDAAPIAKGDGWILRWVKPRVEAPGPIPRRRLDGDTFVRCVPVGLREQLSVTHAEPEHRIATVGFVKFKGIDRVWREEGPEAVAAGLERLIIAVQQAVDAEEVTFLASDIDDDGGKVILTTGVPSTQEDDEGRMLRAMRRIADSEQVFQLKVGANRGHVFAGEIGTEFRSTYTVMGDTVNLAARLMAAALPGEVYAAPGVLDRSLTLFETSALPPFFVKGKTAPVQAYAVGSETGRRPLVSTGELPFTGREAEMEQLRSAITGLDDGNGAAITISGETGLGKTRLVLEALVGVGPEEQLLIRAEPYGLDNPYWAFRDPLRNLLGIERTDQQTMIAKLRSVIESLDPALRSPVPLIGDVTQIEVPDTPETEAIEPRFRPEKTAATLVRLLEALSRGRLLVVIEDAHWLDQASAELVTMLATVAAPLRPWLVIVTTRPQEGALPKPPGALLALGPLEEPAVRRIAIAMTQAAPLRPHQMDAVVERASGNPLFLGEILRLVRETGTAESLPESLDAVVGAEIDTLPPLPRRLLRYSSVLGRSFRRIVLDELLKPEDVELDAATRRVLARFIEAEGKDRYRFRHSVMHDVAYAGLSYRKRRELHGRAGEVIERLAGDDTDAVAEFLALHYAEAGNHEKAWRYGTVAGDRAKTNFANVEAASHYRRALAQARYLKDSVTSREHARLWTVLGGVQEHTGE
jgi:class 3 adenylate cyclase